MSGVGAGGAVGYGGCASSAPGAATLATTTREDRPERVAFLAVRGGRC